MVRLKASGSPAGAAVRLRFWTSTSMSRLPFAHAPLLSAVNVRSSKVTDAATAPSFGTRTTYACEPPFRKNSCTA